MKAIVVCLPCRDTNREQQRGSRGWRIVWQAMGKDISLQLTTGMPVCNHFHLTLRTYIFDIII